MEFKYTGSTHGMNGKGGFISHVNYLGSTIDNTPSHTNPKKDEYYRAKTNYAKTGNHRDLLIMSRDSIYLKRDIDTFSNMRGRSKRDFIADERKLMKGTGRKVKSVDFIVSPSPTGDKLDPNNPYDVSILESYMTMLAHNAFNGYFTKTNQVTKSGYHRYQFHRTKGDRFGYYGVIQPDSHDSSNMHGHLTFFNYDFTSGNGMNRNYYGRNHLRQSVKRTTAEWNQLHPEHQMTGVNHKLTGSRKPTPVIAPVIQAVKAGLSNTRVTSQKKFIKALAGHNIQATRLRKTKHRKHVSWKFRWTGGHRKHSWVSSTRLSGYRGAGSFTAKNIDGTLHQHLVGSMNARRKARQERQHITMAPKVNQSASSGDSSISYFSTEEDRATQSSLLASTAGSANSSDRQLDLDRLMPELQPRGQQDMGTQLTIQPGVNNEQQKRDKVHQRYHTSQHDRSRISSFIAGIKAYSQRTRQNVLALLKRYRDRADRWLKRHGLKLHPFKESKPTHSGDNLISAFQGAAGNTDTDMNQQSEKNKTTMDSLRNKVTGRNDSATSSVSSKEPNSSSSVSSVSSKATLADSLEADQQRQRSEFIKHQKSKAASRAAKRSNISSSGPDWQ